MKKIIVVALIVVAFVGAAIFFKSRNSMKREFSDTEYRKHFDSMEKAVERILGPMHEIVGHAIIPFQVGGAVDMYYFPKGIPGTGFATFELIEPDGTGPKPNRIGTYELLTFTKLAMPTQSRNPDTNDPELPQEKGYRRKSFGRRPNHSLTHIHGYQERHHEFEEQAGVFGTDLWPLPACGS